MYAVLPVQLYIPKAMEDQYTVIACQYFLSE